MASGRSRSAKRASGSVCHNCSSLLIWSWEMSRALIWSLSDGTYIISLEFISVLHLSLSCEYVKAILIESKNKTKPSHRNQPRQEFPILHQRMPLSQLPIHILQRRHGLYTHPTKQYHHTRTTGRYKTQNEWILGCAIVAFQDGIAQRRLGMELDLIGAGAD